MFISVIITAFNRKKYLIDAVKSVLNQTLDKKNYEIIVTKNFEDIELDKFLEENRIKKIKFNKVSIGEQISEVLENSKGEIISFLDDDDLFFPNKLQYVYDIFNNNPEVIYYHNSALIIDEDGKKILNAKNNEPDFNMSSISIKKSILNKNILKNIKVAPDTLMYLFALESGKKIIIGNEILTYYKLHNSLTNITQLDENKIMDFYKNSSLSYLDFYYYTLYLFNSKKSKQFIKSRIFINSLNLYFVDKNFPPKYTYIIYYLMNSKNFKTKLYKIMNYFLIIIAGNRARKMYWIREKNYRNNLL